MGNGKYYKIGVIVQEHVVEVNNFNKECVWVEQVKVNHVKVMKYQRENVMNNHVQHKQK